MTTLSGDKALSFCQKPKSGVQIVLAFGSDEGIASDAAETLTRAWRKAEGGELDVVRFNEDEVRRDKAMLADALIARSLLGGAQLIRLSLTNEYLAGLFEELIKDVDAGKLKPENYLIVTAGDLTKKSKTRAAFEKSTTATMLQLRADNEEKTESYIKARLDADKIDIEPDALALFAAELPGDRRLTNSEIEKLALYALDLGRPVSTDDIRAVAATEQPRGADDAADAALAGRARAAITAVDRYLDAGGSAISALRTLHFRLLRVVSALAGEKYLRPPVFDNERPAFNAMLKDWTPPRAARALTMLYKAELTCKQAGAPAEAALKTVIDRIARRAV